jgi:hypothetical protein
MLNNAIINKVYAATRPTSLADILGKGKFDGVKKNLGDLNNLILEFIKLALDLAVALAFIMVLYSAFLYITSYGEEGKIKTAKDTFLWSIIGLIVIIISQLIVDMVKNQLQ